MDNEAANNAKYFYPKAVVGAAAAKAQFVRIAAIGFAQMLRSIANDRFREAATQRLDYLRMSGKGRHIRSPRNVVTSNCFSTAPFSDSHQTALVGLAMGL
jgi:hypothetical protein